MRPRRLPLLTATLIWLCLLAAPLRAAEPAPTDPAKARALYEQGSILAQDKDYEKAVPLLEQALRLDPALKGAWESLGWSYWRLNRRADALALWEKLRLIDPLHPLPYTLLAKAAAATNDLAGAIALSRRSLELAPRQFGARADLARFLLWSDEIEESVSLFEELLAEEPERADIRLDLARALSQTRRHDKALPLWTQLRERAPTQGEYWAMEGAALLHANQPEAARAHFRKALELAPGHLVALEGLADLEEYGPTPGEALPHLRDLLKAQPDRTEQERVRVRLINLLVRLHRVNPLAHPLDEAITLSEDRLEYDPSSVDALLLQGELKLMDLDFPQAEERFVQVLRDFNPNNIRARRGLFETYIAARHFAKAREQLDALRRFNPRDPYLDLFLARLESARGDFGAAFQALDRLEARGRKGAVAVLLYHGLTPSRYFTEALAVDRFEGQLQAMKEAGFQFVKSGDIPALFAAATNPVVAAAAPVPEPAPVVAPPPPPPPAPTSSATRVATPESRERRAPQPVLSRRKLPPPPPPPPPPEPEPEPEPAPAPPAPPALPIQVSINFDDARQDTLMYGTPVARKTGLVFSHHVPCGYLNRNHPFIASWKQLEEAAASGCWEFGSHFVDAAILTRLGPSSKPGRALPNLIWREDLGRMETPEEYDARLVYEFQDSRRQLRERTGQSVNFISYPFGDIGQETESNLENPIPAIVETGRAHYDAGFIQSVFGFAISGDDPMLYQRHEMERWMEGSNVVEYVYAHHPVFIARRLRAEYAALSGRQYRALDNIEWLKQNGYPPRLLEETRRYVEKRLAGGFVPPTEAAAARKAARDLDALKLRLRAEADYFQDNEDRTHYHLYAGGGMNLGERVAVDGRMGVGKLEQDLDDPVDGKTSLEVDEASAGVRGVLLFVSDPAAPATDLFPKYISAGLNQRQFSGDADSSMTALEAETQFRPFLPLDLLLRYERDLAPSALAAVEEIDYNSGLASGVYRLRDWWTLHASGSLYDFSDDNTREHLNLGTRWLLHERSGLWFGLRYGYVNADEDREAYWTPYKLNRYTGELQFQGNMLRIYYNLRGYYGVGQEEVRPEEEERYEETAQRARLEGWDPGPAPDEDWDTVYGGSFSTRIPLQNRWEMNGEVSYNRNPDYNELSVFGGVSFFFR